MINSQNNTFLSLIVQTNVALSFFFIQLLELRKLQLKQKVTLKLNSVQKKLVLISPKGTLIMGPMFLFSLFELLRL